ncbi:MAG: class I mannose-6-phosphate isomerase [Dysgonamonadaceae bacterium]|jgi:mannose-6-phosphate isomerase|nr:class I mannose-6-phosphate isomerase [Dysgonamonadaceae bacterium]
MLEPLKFKPILKEIIWGGEEICRFKGIESVKNGIGESWELSGVKNNVSVVSEGRFAGKSLDELLSQYGEKLLGKRVFEKFGTDFPLLIKFIDARTPLSIQVHPNDELAKKRHNSAGKTEMWYVVKAAPGAYLYSGFAKQITPEQYVESLGTGDFINYLQRYEVSGGDVFFLPAGRVHAIGSGCFIAEIQQTSDITYRIYDYNRKDADGKPRELHTALAKDAIDYAVYPDYRVNYKVHGEETELVSCPYFTTELIKIEENTTFIPQNAADSFRIFIGLAGKARIFSPEKYRTNINAGETVLLPAECGLPQIFAENSAKLLQVYIK